jgi:uncharacterized membrane protein
MMRTYDAGEERNWVLALYGLFLIGPATSGLTALIGVVLAHLRLDAARGSPYEGHYRNLILVFWVWLAAVLIAGALFIAGLAGSVMALILSRPDYHAYGLFQSMLTVGLTVLGLIIVCIWYYWRLIVGFIRILDDRPY